MNQSKEKAVTYQFGPFYVDPLNRILVREGKTVALPPKSFDLLSLMVQNSGRLLDKDYLLNHVWSDVAVEENSLTRAVSDIRKALGESPGQNRFIATIARHGYRFLPHVTLHEPVEQTEAQVSLNRAMSVAVLPFNCLIPEGDDKPLAVGMADALITRLSSLPQIVVRPTASILRYADDPRDPLVIASELRVDFVLSGSIQHIGERVRITAQVINLSEQRSVWAEHFEERLTHIFALEDSISSRIVAALALKITNAQKESLARLHTLSSDAYQAYLRGRYFWSKQTLAGAHSANAYFRQAIEIDSRYAQAWAGIADALILIGLSGSLTGGLPPCEVYPEARKAALSALELDDSLVEARSSLGFIKLFYDWDLAGSQIELSHALALQPNYATAHHGRALGLGFTGQFEDALKAIDEALEIEPLSLIFNANKGYLLYIAGLHRASVEHLERTLEIDSTFAPTRYRLGLALAALGRLEESVEHVIEVRRLSDESPHALGALGYLYGLAGREEGAREILRRLDDLSKIRYVSPTIQAEVLTGLRQYDDAVRWLSKALDERNAALFAFRVDSRFECLWSDPRFVELAKALPQA